MTRAWAACLLVVAALTAPAAAARAQRVELLTIEPGDALWTRFGHTAVRVQAGAGDMVFSFGYAPFDAPGFAWDYMRGKAQFRVASRSWEAMRALYANQNRTFVRQPLRLSPQGALRMANALATYLEPENQSYVYDQLTDNCATRVRDLLDDATGGALRRTVQGPTGTRYRHHTLEAAGGDVLLSFALDFVGGPNQDRRINGWQALYLPQRLREAVRKTQLNGHPLGPQEIVVFRRHGPPANKGPVGSGRYAWAGLCALLAALFGLSRGRRAARMSAIALFALGLWLGTWALVVDTLVLLSRVPDFRWNENVLLFWPTDLVLCWAGVRTWAARSLQMPRWLTRYLAVHAMGNLLVAALTAAGALAQDNTLLAISTALPLGALALRGRLSSCDSSV